MIETLTRSWALLLGVLLLMLGNGIQSSLLGIRGTIEGFTTTEMSIIMSAFFAGFLGGSRVAPEMIRRVGHVRVFAALASFISATLILFPIAANPWAWVVLRFVLGFCFSGVYVTSESWLNNAASNENRGKAMSLYMVIQSLGIVSAQGLLVLADPSGFILFAISSVLVSIAFAPILLSVTPTPAFATSKPMSFMELYRVTPLGCIGMFMVGAAYSAIFGMAAVYGSEAGFSVPQISMFVAMMFIGGMSFQFPVGIISDRMDRRKLIVMAAVTGTIGATIGAMSVWYPLLLLAAFLVGGVASPIYSLLIAYTNDYLQPDDMSAASGRLMFISGMGSIGGPLATGWLLSHFGPPGFFIFLVAVFSALTLYGLYRSTRRQAPSIEESSSYALVLPTTSQVAFETSQDQYTEWTDSDPDATDETDQPI